MQKNKINSNGVQKQRSFSLFLVLGILVLFLVSGCQSAFTLSYTGDYCEDGLQDRDEEDVDCGGQYCAACSSIEPTQEPQAQTSDGASDQDQNSPDLSDESSEQSDEQLEPQEIPVPPAVPSVSLCQETDGGFAMYASGTITSEVAGVEITQTDSCLTAPDGVGSLTEWYCDANGLAVMSVLSCQGSCTTDGASCERVQSQETRVCSDEEEENNVYLGGTALMTITTDGVVITESYADACDAATSVLTEYGCTDTGYLTTVPVTCAFGCADSFSCEMATDPAAIDTDSDGLTDQDEENLYGTYPTVADSDYDGLSDYEEVMKKHNYKTDPLDADSDDDGLRDDKEIFVSGTNPKEADTDGDGLSDYDEVKGTKEYFTDPTEEDTDADHVSDADEIDLGTDPTSGYFNVARGEAVTLRVSGVDHTIYLSDVSASSDPQQVSCGFIFDEEESVIPIYFGTSYSLNEDVTVSVIDYDEELYQSCTFVVTITLEDQ